MATPATICASGQLQAADLYRFSLTTLYRRFWWFLGIMAVVAVFFISSLFRGNIKWEWTWGNVWGPLFPFVLVPYAFFLAPYLAARKQVRTNPNLNGPMKYVFSDEGIEFTGPNVQAHFDWNAIVEVRETSAQFLFYPQQSVAYVIPKRFLAGPADRAALRALVRSHTTKSKLQH